MSTRNDPDMSDIELARWLTIVRRRFFLLLTVTIGFAGMAIAFGISRTPTYEATASVLVQRPLTDIQSPSSAPLAIDSEVKLANSDVVMRQVRARLATGRGFSYRAVADGPVISFVATANTAKNATSAATASASAYLALRQAAVSRQYDAAEGSLNQAIASIDTRIAVAADVAESNALTAQRANYLAALNQLLVQSDLASGGGTQKIGLATAPTRTHSQLTTYGVVGGLVGLLLALVLAVILDHNDDRIDSLRGLGDALDGEGHRTALLAQVASGARRLRIAGTRAAEPVSLAAAGSAAGDSYALLRTALESQLPQPAVLVGTAGDDGDAQEVALNLAASFARTQRRTLLVSSDLRRRNQRNMLDYAFAGGHNQPTSGPTFSEVLFGDATSEGLSAQAPLMDYLWHMPAGDVTSTLSLADLDLTALQAAIDAIRDDFDAVVMICPSVTRYPDAAVLARVTDGLLLAASARHTRASDVRDATRLIDQVGGQVLGGVLTGPRAGSRGQRVRMSMTAAALGRDDWLGGMPAVPLDAPSAPASLRNVLVHRPAHRGEVTKAVRRSPGARG